MWYVETMVLAQGEVDGFVLASVVHDNKEPVDSALMPLAGQRCAQALGRLREAERAMRARTLRTITARMRGQIQLERVQTFPPRARALLATEVPKSLGSGWLREAGPPRRGFRATDELRAFVRRWSAAAALQARSARERERLRRILCLG